MSREGHMTNVLWVKIGGKRYAFSYNHQIGAIEKGRRADLVVVDGDPLADVRVLQSPERIRLVLKDGRVEVRR